MSAVSVHQGREGMGYRSVYRLRVEGWDAGEAGNIANQPWEILGRWPLATALIVFGA